MKNVDQKENQERLLEIRDLRVRVKGKEVVQGVDLAINRGEVVALMGPNGSGKSSLAKAVMGSGEYEVEGNIFWYGGDQFQAADRLRKRSLRGTRPPSPGIDLTELEMYERARLGLFLAWQNPPAIEGVKVFSLVRESLRARGKKVESMVELKKKLQSVLERVGLGKDFWNREVNVGMSGGEKKRLLLALMLILEPKLVILDEIDSGLDVDSLKVAGEVVREMRRKGTGFLIITHYGRFLEYVEVDRVVVMKDGRVVERGGEELVRKIEKEGFGGRS